MEPRTIVVTDEIAYQRYLEAQANGRLLDISQITHDLANASMDGDQVERFSAHVEALLAQLMDSGLTAFLPETSTSYASVEESNAAKRGE
jgi:hypothetical protein